MENSENVNNSYTLMPREDIDRLGANIFSYIIQIIMCHKKNYFINVNTMRYENSIFIKSIKDYILILNKNKTQKPEKKINEITNGLLTDVNEYTFSGILVNNIIQCDVFSYFKKYIFNKINKILINYAINNNYKILFDPKKTICVHLRLDDLNENNSLDFDGEIVQEFYSNIINNNSLNKKINYKSLNASFYKHLIKKNIDIRDQLKYKCGFLKVYGFQSFINENKILKIINEILTVNADYKVIIIASPNGIVNLPYCTIRSDDENFDLYCLCNCDKLILSRSTFALSSVFFSTASEIWIPNWGCSVMAGLNTKYDNSNFHYYN